jgi:hypothetical protein
MRHPKPGQTYSRMIVLASVMIDAFFAFVGSVELLSVCTRTALFAVVVVDNWAMRTSLKRGIPLRSR